jgi:hypothetical protein
MKIGLRIDAADARAKLRRWADDFRPQVWQAADDAMKREAVALTADARSHVADQMKVVKRGFLKSFRAKVYDANRKRLPVLNVASKVPWVGIHETGGSISGRMLIPLYGRVGLKTFRAQIRALMASGNAFFIKDKKGQVLLMAENLRENAGALAGFKRRYRKAEGLKRLSRRTEIPIAVLVPRVTLKKRLDIQGLVVSRLPRLTAQLLAQLARTS